MESNIVSFLRLFKIVWINLSHRIFWLYVFNSVTWIFCVGIVHWAVHYISVTYPFLCFLQFTIWGMFVCFQSHSRIVTYFQNLNENQVWNSCILHILGWPWWRPPHTATPSPSKLCATLNLPYCTACLPFFSYCCEVMYTDVNINNVCLWDCFL